jgi:predicted HTH transcriptional regulator
MNLVEAWGSGIPKLMKAMKEYGLKEPEFIDMDVAFRINLYRGQDDLNDTNDTKRDTNDTKQDIDDTEHHLEEQLLSIIRDNESATQKFMSEQLDISLITVKRMLSRLQENGKVVRKGSNRKGKWLIQKRK